MREGLLEIEVAQRLNALVLHAPDPRLTVDFVSRIMEQAHEEAVATGRSKSTEVSLDPLGVRARPGVPQSRKRLAAISVVAVLCAGAFVVVRQGFERTPTSKFGNGGGVEHAWRELPAAPIPGREAHVAVWTGREMIVMGGNTSGGRLQVGINDVPVRADGAAFNPQLNTWRAIADDKFGGRSGATAVWTGTEMMVAGGSNPTEKTGRVRRIDAYNPVSDSWRVVSELPFESAGYGYVQVFWLDGSLYAADSLDASLARWHGIWKFDGSTWMQLPSPVNGQRLRNVAVISGVLTAFGDASLYRHNSISNSWTTQPLDPALDTILGTIRISNTDYVIGETARRDNGAPADLLAIDLDAEHPALLSRTSYLHDGLEPAGQWGQPLIVGVGVTAAVLTTGNDLFRPGAGWTKYPQPRWGHNYLPSAVSTGNAVIVWGGSHSPDQPSQNTGSLVGPNGVAVIYSNVGEMLVES